MMTGSDSNAVAGGLARHIPVLARRAIDWLGVHSGGLYIDATFGAGGYTRAILQTPGARVIGIDRDQAAIAQGAALVAQARGRLELVEDRFSNLASIAGGAAAADGIVFDLGVSSMQLDEAARGFSFRLDGPLDMRMGRDGPSAADVVARAGERDLAAIIATLGEEHHARAIARAIVKARSERAIETTRALADIVARVVRAREGAIHPATRTFQALADFRQRRTRRIGARPCRRRARAEAVRPSRRGRVPLARRSHRQNLSRRAQPRAGGLAPPSRRRGAAADVPRADAAAGNAGRSRNRRQSARPLGQAARRRAHRCAGRAPRQRRICCRGCRRSPTSCGGGRDPARAQFRRDRSARARRGLGLSDQVRRHRPGRTPRQAARRGAPRARRDRRLARRMGTARRSGAHRGAGQALFASQAHRSHAIRHARSSARPAAGRRHRQYGSDRRHDRKFRGAEHIWDDRKHSGRGGNTSGRRQPSDGAAAGGNGAPRQ